MNFKNEKGVTLLTLVVTIVVMLILASIVITTSVGDNGLIEETKLATIEASVREVEEAIATEILLKDKENIKNGDFENTGISDLKEIYDEEDIEVESEMVDVDRVTYKIYTITKEGLKKLNIKGEYGNTKGIFRIKENTNTGEYIVEYKD